MEMILKTYHPAQQHWGTYLSGFPWNIYGCGTYREPVGPVKAEALMKRYIERLERKVKADVAFFAARESRTSGCGMSPIPLHWHFVAASKHSYDMDRVAQDLWTDRFGESQVEPFDPTGDGLYYICKLANHPNGEFLFGKLDKLRYEGPQDLIAAAHSNAYVPDRLKDKVFGEYLTLRPPVERRTAI